MRNSNIKPAFSVCSFSRSRTSHRPGDHSLRSRIGTNSHEEYLINSSLLTHVQPHHHQIQNKENHASQHATAAQVTSSRDSSRMRRRITNARLMQVMVQADGQ